MDIKKQKELFSELQQLLERYGLEALAVFDEDARTFKQVEAMSVNGAFLQLTTEKWSEE